MPKHNLGGQAVLEGLMMQTPEKMAIAVRCRNGSIVLFKESLQHYLSENRISRIPVLRGMMAVWLSILTGLRALDYSSKIYLYDAEKLNKYQGMKNVSQPEIVSPSFSSAHHIVATVFLLSMCILFIIPGSLLKVFFPKLFSTLNLLSLYEPFIILALIILYLFAISLIPEIYRAFQYHGAEHKVIHAYEQNLDLTIDNIKQCSRYHYRCGTLFLFYSFIIGMIGFSFIPQEAPIWLHTVIRMLALPLVAGLSYEFLAYLDKKDSLFGKVLAYPGIVFQNLTTREPEDTHLEVGLSALLALLEDSTFK